MTFSKDFLRWDALRDRIEGVYSKQKNDRGGATLYGWALKWNPDIDPETFTPEDSRQRTYDRYWTVLRCDEIQWPINLVLADWCFNSSDPRGPSYPEKVFQRIVGAKVDGDIGPETVAACRASCEAHGALDIARTLHRRRVSYLGNVVQHDATQLDFLEGWMNRCFDVWDLARDPA